MCSCDERISKKWFLTTHEKTLSTEDVPQPTERKKEEKTIRMRLVLSVDVGEIRVSQMGK